MAQAEAVDISRLVDERGITRFNIGLMFAFFIVLIDGLTSPRPETRANRIVGDETAIRDPGSAAEALRKTEPRCDQPGR